MWNVIVATPLVIQKQPLKFEIKEAEQQPWVQFGLVWQKQLNSVWCITMMISYKVEKTNYKRCLISTKICFNKTFIHNFYLI